MAPLVPTLAAHARSLFHSSANAARSELGNFVVRSITAVPRAEDYADYGPLAARSMIAPREEDTSEEQKTNPHAGTVSFRNVNNTAVFVIFGLIGMAFVVTIIWFFFWAKNGGFYFKQDDWDDYKSTVLRRKGPNGTLLSGATPSTNLGGGSVYKDYDARTEYTGGLTEMTQTTSSTLSGITAGASDILGREKRRQKREKRDREREKKKDRKSRSKNHARHESQGHVDEHGNLVDEEAEAAARGHLRAYRHEKAARVGGINKDSEGSQWDGSTHHDGSTAFQSSVVSGSTGTDTYDYANRRNNDVGETETDLLTTNTTPTREHRHSSKRDKQDRATRKAGGIRKVYSAADRTADRENERIKAEARRLQDKGRAAASSRGGRRDFSYQRAPVGPSSAAAGAQSSMIEAGTIEEERDGDLGSGAGRYLPPGSWGAMDVHNGNGGGYSYHQQRQHEDESEVEQSDLGTKSYRHVIPGLSVPSQASDSAAGSAVGGSSEVSGASSYADEKRRRRAAGGGREKLYRRGEE